VEINDGKKKIRSNSRAIPPFQLTKIISPPAQSCFLSGVPIKMLAREDNDKESSVKRVEGRQEGKQSRGIRLLGQNDCRKKKRFCTERRPEGDVAFYN